MQIIEKGHDVTLVWIPSHTGIKGNEEADEYAKKAASLASPLSPMKLT